MGSRAAEEALLGGYWVRGGSPPPTISVVTDTVTHEGRKKYVWEAATGGKEPPVKAGIPVLLSDLGDVDGGA